MTNQTNQPKPTNGEIFQPYVLCPIWTSCSWPNPGLLLLLPRFRFCPDSCSRLAPAAALLLLCKSPGPTLLQPCFCSCSALAPAMLLLLNRFCPAPARRFCKASAPALLRICSCPVPTSPLLPPCPAPAPALLLPSSLLQPQLGSLHHQRLTTFFRDGENRLLWYLVFCLVRKTRKK